MIVAVSNIFVNINNSDTIIILISKVAVVDELASLLLDLNKVNVESPALKQKC